jgi:hypothetical protein
MARLVRTMGGMYPEPMNLYAACLMLVLLLPGTMVLVWLHPWLVAGFGVMGVGYWLLSHDADPGIVLAGREHAVTGAGLALVALGGLIMALVMLNA